MILDDALVAPGHEDEMLDAGLAGLVDHMLDQRAIDHRQHLLGHCLGGGQEPCAEAGDRENGLASRFHEVAASVGSIRGLTWNRGAAVTPVVNGAATIYVSHGKASSKAARAKK